jgi:hypothetical protein
MPKTLDEFHAALERHMAEGDALLDARDPGSANLVKQKVAEAVMLIASYQMFVHREVFAPLLAQQEPGLRARVTELKVECIALTEDLRFNTRDFIASDAPLDWGSLASSVAWFNGRVRDHLANVRRAMSPDLTDAEHAVLRSFRTGTVGAQAA